MAGIIKKAIQGEEPDAPAEAGQEMRDPNAEPAEGGDEAEPQSDVAQEAQDPNAEAAEEGGNQITPEKIRAENKMPPNLKQAYDRVVLAGMKVMFSQETHAMATKVLEGDGPIEERLAKGIAGLMGTLVQQSNNTMPPQVLVPAGIELLVSAADYLNKSGTEPVNDQQISEAMAQFVQLILDQVGASSPEQVQQMLQQNGGGAPEGAPQPGAGTAPAAPAPGPKGLIQSQMGA